MTRSRSLTLFLLAVCLNALPAAAQTRLARLQITVVDPSRLIIPDATVSVVGADGLPGPTAQTSDKGLAIVEGLTPGRYAIEAQFAGFEQGVLKDVLLRPGDNRHVIVLPMQKLQNEVTVARDAQAAAADPRARFAMALTAEEIEALSDDPTEMEQQLKEMAGPTAIIRIDSFEGGRLPPKAQIKSIHITRDAFAAENHFAGHPFVDVITQPGVGAIRGGGNVRLRDGSMSGRSPFSPVKGPEQTQAYGFNVAGPLLHQRSSFSLSINRLDSYDTPIVYVALPGGETRSELGPRRPNDNLFVSGLLDYAITRDQTLRVSVQRDRTTSRNLGVGAYDEAERAYATETGATSVRIQEAGPLGRRFFTNTRLQIGRTNSDSSSLVDAVTYRVTDARTMGGAQIRGGRRTTIFNLYSDLDYVRGIHSVRTGIAIEGGRYRSDDFTNYLGTYVFENLAAFEQRRPRSYTRRIGDPNISYANVQAGVYVQDDIKVRKSLTLSPGVRYELQTHLRDYGNVGPRFGLSWAPFKSGRTTIRGSWGIFYDWLALGTYEQALRVDGFRQRELNIANPSFPDPGDVGSITATNRYLLPGDLSMVRNTRLSLGLDQAISPRVRVAATFATVHGRGLLRGRNLNAPVNGTRPDPAVANVIEVVGDAASRQYFLNTNANITLAPPSPALNRTRVNWRRTTFNVAYSHGKVENNTDGPFSLPFSGSPAGEWAEINHEIRRHRFNAGVNTSAIRNLTASLTLNAITGAPYTITTGRDGNGDLVYNDRPAGVGRNTEWMANFWTVNGNFAYFIPLGGGTVSAPIGGGGDRMVLAGAATATKYRIAITVNINNLVNHDNYAGFSGAMTSPFFLQPTTVLNPRKVDVGIAFTF